MLPFRVQCETCQSWLKVARESLVGQIHSCPKCGSMVHLVPKEEGAPDGGAERSPAAAVAPAAAAPVAASDFDSVDQLGLDDAAPKPQPAATQAPTTQSPAPQPAEAAAAAPLPADAAARVSPIEAAGQKTALITGAGGAILIVFGAVAYWLTSGEPDPSELAQAEQAASPAASQIDSTSSGDQPLVPAPSTPPENSADVGAEPPVEDPAPIVPELPPLEDEAVTAQQPAEPPGQPVRQQPDPTPRVAEKRIATNDPPTPLSDAPPEIDPLEFDPSKLDLVMLRGDRKPPEPEPEPAEAPRLAIGWNARSGQTPPTEPPPTEELNRIDGQLAERGRVERVWVERGTTAFENHRPVDLARRLGDTLPELQLPEAPLTHGVRVWSELAGAPVTIDPQALARAGVSARSRIRISGANATLGDLLSETLKPLRLMYAERDGQLTLTRLGGQTERTGAYSAADLAGSPAELDELCALAAAMVPSTSEGTLSVDGQKLKFAGPANTHFDLVIFCERLRRARGLPQKTKYPAALLATRPPLARLESPLSRSATFSFVAPTPFADVLDHWRGASGLEILVDWSSVARAELGPQSQVRCSSRDQPWRDSLDGVLHPLGLGWRVVDERTLQIAGRADAAAEYPTTEFYPLAKNADGAESADELTGELSQLKTPVAIRFDAPARALVIHAADDGHRAAYDWLVRNGLIES
ncbi:hypothetical protein KOR34_35310 [Posidoniimonas corsicana]|uniref:Uncharacterized protein n=1 Tax=Posidoniimonas corsicana TaxID=1938618 RepID=A0A5C5V592_9BACT|nr:hypothetical protein [Posidoniimonas corsicana]TWT33698.1 hypothetical protein KOR34_35310 [Posidoniimonas corsicana]